MPRGTYQPLDRDRHFLVAWGSDAAIRDARARVLEPVLPAVRVVSQAQRGIDAGKTLVSGMRMLDGRREADRSLAHVGGEWFHSVADRVRAIAQITAGFRTFVTDLGRWYFEHQNEPGIEVRVRWFAVDVTPAIEEWNTFAARETSSWLVRATTSWATFVEWNARLRSLRSLARAHGITLLSPEPELLPQTVWEKSDKGKGSEVTPWIGVLKFAVGGTFTLLGAATLYSIVRDLRKKALPAPPESK